MKGLYRIRLGDYRIIYQVDDKKVRVLIVRVGQRKDVYEALLRAAGVWKERR